jgi:DNA (cytosine-5)-methyltransferase 1
MASGAGMERPAGMAGETSFLVAHSPRTDGFDASEDSTDRGTPLVLSPYARAERDYMLADLDGEGFSGRPFYGDGEDDGDQVAVAFADVAQPVRTNPHNNSDAGMEATMHVHIAPSLTAYNMDSRSPQSEEQQRIVGAVYAASSAVRRLTPRECERLQGFPDDYTAVPYRGKPAADGPRYRALGNSMAVPVMRWIGERIAMIERDHLT